MFGNTFSFLYALYRWLYWSSYARIERASMDGTSRTTLHTSNLNYPYALTLDYDTQTLYWADYSANRIEKSSTTGSDRVLLTTNVYDPYYITFYNGQLYWSDLYQDDIYTMSVSSPNVITMLTDSLTYEPQGLQIVSLDRQPEGWYIPLIDRCLKLDYYDYIMLQIKRLEWYYTTAMYDTHIVHVVLAS